MTREEVREEITKRWSTLGFTDGLHGRIKETIRELYESTAKPLDTLTEQEERLEKLRDECHRCAAAGDNPCRGCEINEEKNELLKQIEKQ